MNTGDLHKWSKKLLNAEEQYKKMYKKLASEKPPKCCMADWRCSRTYKNTLRKRSEPIRRKIKEAKLMLKELTK